MYGMERSAVILYGDEDPKRWRELAGESWIVLGERYVLAAEHEDPRGVALRWLREGREPEV